MSMHAVDRSVHGTLREGPFDPVPFLLVLTVRSWDKALEALTEVRVLRTKDFQHTGKSIALK